MPIFIDSPDPEDDHAARLSRRLELEAELRGNLTFDDLRVFERLHLDRVASGLVKGCVEALNEDPGLCEARRRIECVIESVVRKEMEHEQTREDEDESWDPLSGREYEEVRYFSAEKEMYKPLTSIFEYIERFSGSCNAPPKRSFLSKDTIILEADPHAQSFPKRSPDFVLLEHASTSMSTPSYPSGPQGRTLTLWHHTAAFCLLRPSPHEGPRHPPTLDRNRKPIASLVRQAAEYARMHLSARPFLLFSVALLIFGSQFCIVIFDRAGAQISPIHDMWADTQMFICVVRSLTCLLSDVELGHDPTVDIMTGGGCQRNEKEQDREGVFEHPEFPTYAINMSGRVWYTLSSPMWTSVSLFGQGTSVWLIRETGAGHIFVLMNTWKSSSKPSEAASYFAIRGGHRALEKICMGEDVYFPGSQSRITAHSLRGEDSNQAENSEAKGHNVVLHRLLFETRGRPLWEYRSEKELLLGIRAALSAHQFLCKQGILHRDIHAGNIMLSAEATPEAGEEGILLASSVGDTVEAAVFHGDTDTAIHSIPWSSTAPFMATEILKAIVMKVPIKYEPKHDMESIIYVLGYALTRRLLIDSQVSDPSTHESLRNFFRAAFGQMSLEDQWMANKGQAPLGVVRYSDRLLSEAMVELVEDLDSWLAQSRLRPQYGPKPITHVEALMKLDMAIAQMD